MSLVSPGNRVEGPQPHLPRVGMGRDWKPQDLRSQRTLPAALSAFSRQRVTAAPGSLMPTVCRQMGELLGPLPCCQASETVGLYKNRATLSPLETSPSVLGVHTASLFTWPAPRQNTEPGAAGRGLGPVPPVASQGPSKQNCSPAEPGRGSAAVLWKQSWRPRRASSVDALSALHKMGGQMLSEFFLFGKLKRGLRGRGVAWACSTRGYPCAGPGGRGEPEVPRGLGPLDSLGYG